MVGVCRVEGNAGLVLGEEQGVQRVPDQGTSINCDGGEEKSGVNTLIRWLFAEHHL